MIRVSCLAILAACSHPLVTEPTHGDAPPVVVYPHPTGPHYHYVVNHITIPTTLASAGSVGVDYSGDGAFDNHFGAGLAALAGAGFDLQGPVDRALGDGTLILLIDIQTESFATAQDPIGITFFAGTNPSPSPCTDPTDTVCGRHLDGNGSFEVAPLTTDNPGNSTLVGSLASGTLASSTRGNIDWTVIHLPIIGPVPIFIELREARVVATDLTADNVGALTLAGVIGYPLDWNDYESDSTVGSLRPELATMVTSQCSAVTSPPACGCASGSLPALILAYFDTAPADCDVSFMEIDSSPFNTGGDISLGGPFDSGMSFGIQMTAVRASFTDNLR